MYRERVVATVRASPVTIVAGDTGCGKSTQVRRRRAVSCRACVRASGVCVCA